MRWVPLEAIDKVRTSAENVISPYLVSITKIQSTYISEAGPETMVHEKLVRLGQYVTLFV